jgi:hypothetical protein
MTTLQQSIAAKARSSYDKEDYLVAFNLLSDGGLDFFVSYAEKVERDRENNNIITKKNWLSDGKSAEIFWNQYVLQDHIFHALLNSESAITLLHNYFSKFRKRVYYFEVKLVRFFPEIYVQAVRLNQVFLKTDRIDFLTSIKFSKSINIAHQSIWKHFYDRYFYSLNQVENRRNELNDECLIEILAIVVLWLKIKRQQSNELMQSLTQLGSVYSAFIEIVVSKHPELNKDFDVNDFELYSGNVTPNYNHNSSNRLQVLVFSVLEDINYWIEYFETVIQPYSYDLNIEVEKSEQGIFLKQTPESFYLWKVDGERYNQNKKRYLKSSLKETKNLVEDPFAFEICSCNKFIDDLQIKKYGFGQNAVATDTTHEILINSSRIILSDVLIDNIENFKLENVSDELTKNIIENFGYNVKSSKPTNLVNGSYNVWLNPFLKFNNTIFCPSIFLNMNWGIYTFAQKALTGEHVLNETRNLEKHLYKEFSKQNWKVKLISDQEASRMSGDIDLFINDDNTTLLIQLKKPSFRLNPKDSYYESMLSDTKAYRQLNEGEEYLRNPNEIFQLKHDPVKWIVSTSFEFIQKNYFGCKKENYFEILFALRQKKFSSLQEFVEFTENDHIFSDISLSLNDFPSVEFRKLIIPNNTEKHLEFDKLYQNALIKNELNRKDEAIKLFENCLMQIPDDFDCLCSVANLYADIKSYSKAIEYFDMALKVIPNEPHCKHDFAICLIESGKYYDGILMLSELTEDYPLIKEFEIEFVGYFYNSVLNMTLENSQQFEILQNKVKKLKT